MALSGDLLAHLQGGATQLCRCWSVERRDGVVLGFTDHDRDLEFDGITFRADTGMSASSMEQSSGLAVDNAEALGVLSASAITRADLDAGRYDGATVRMWLVNWADVAMRALRFSGSIGEVRVDGQAFRAELRGLSEALNRPMGRIYQKTCAARLGDGACGVDVSRPEFSVETVVAEVVSASTLRLDGLGAYAANWFERGSLRVLDGDALGLGGAIKHDKASNGYREIVLWEEIRVPVEVGQQVRVVAGCDKLAETCRAKFGNIVNFRGFPHLPGEDWLMAYPRGGGSKVAAE